MGISSIEISASGMRAQRLRMDLIASNLANVDTTSARAEAQRAPDGRAYERHIPYRRKIAIFQQGIPDRRERLLGVSVPSVVEDSSPFRAEHNPGHAHAVPVASGASDAGVVYYPNVHPIVEMVDMISASRAYEANVTAVDTLKSMGSATLRILA